MAFGDKYALEVPLGESEAWTIWAATEVATKLRVVLVVLEDDAPAALGERLLEQGRALAKVTHPNLARVLEADVNEEGAAYLAVERLEGTSLAKRWEEGPALRADRTLELGIGVVEGLQKLHELGFAHGDVEPGNVLLVGAPGKEIPKLIGFGLERTASRIAPEARASVPSLAAIAFAAPEQARGEVSASKSADLYSAAALIYAGLAGRPPHVAEDEASLRAALASEPALAFSSIRKDLAAFAATLDRGLQLDPKRRFADAGALLRALRTALAMGRVVANKETPIGPRSALGEERVEANAGQPGSAPRPDASPRAPVPRRVPRPGASEPKAPEVDTKASGSDAKAPEVDTKASGSDAKAPEVDAKASESAAKAPEATATGPSADEAGASEREATSPAAPEPRSSITELEPDEVEFEAAPAEPRTPAPPAPPPPAVAPVVVVKDAEPAPSSSEEAPAPSSSSEAAPPAAAARSSSEEAPAPARSSSKEEAPTAPARSSSSSEEEAPAPARSSSSSKEEAPTATAPTSPTAGALASPSEELEVDEPPTLAPSLGARPPNWLLGALAATALALLGIWLWVRSSHTPEPAQTDSLGTILDAPPRDVARAHAASPAASAVTPEPTTPAEGTPPGELQPSTASTSERAEEPRSDVAAPEAPSAPAVEPSAQRPFAADAPRVTPREQDHERPSATPRVSGAPTPRPPTTRPAREPRPHGAEAPPARPGRTTIVTDPGF